MERYKKLGKNIALITMGNMLSKMMSFFLIPFYTAVLTTAEYGIADTMTTTVNLLLPVFTLLINEAMMRYALESGSNKEAIFTTSIATVVCGTAVFLCAAQIAFSFIELQVSHWYFVVYYIAVALHTVCSYFTRGIEKVHVYSLSGIIQTLCFLLLNVLFLAVWKLGITGYLISMIAGNIVATIYLFIHAKLGAYFQPKQFDKKLLKDMLRYSVPMIPNSLSWWVSNSSDKYFILFFCGLSATGIYSAAQRIPSMFALISTIFMGAWQISSVEDFGSEKTNRFFSNVYRQYSALNTLLVSGLILLVKPISAFMLSADFASGWKYIPVLLFAFLFHALSSFLGSVYTAAKKTKMIFISTFISALINIVLNAALIPILDIQGAALATLISYFVVWLIRLIHSRNVMVISWNKHRDIVSYFLIGAQAVCMLICGDAASYIISSVLFTVILIINSGEMIQLFKVIKNSLRKK